MSDELTLVEGDPPPRTRSRCRDRSDSILDTVSYFAIGFVFVGLIFSAIGFMYPRGVRHDPKASAAENEQAEIQYMQLTKALNAIIVAGMILTGLGGLILSAIFTTTVVCRECHEADNAARKAVTSRKSTSPTTSSRSGPTAGNANGNVNYGAVPESGSSVGQ